MKRLLVRWFVQYDPMFTASALCVLGGVLLASRALGDGAGVALTAVLELYQWLVIGTAAVLYRRLHEHRSAAILGLVALVLLVDPTLQVSALADGERVLPTLVWLALFALKARALEHAFRLRLSTAARGAPLSIAALSAAAPNARLLGVDDALLPRVLAVAVFVVGAAIVLAAPRASSLRALGETGQAMFPRLLRATAAILCGGLVYQCGNALLAIDDVAAAPVAGALALVGVVATRVEGRAWALVALAGLFFAASGDVVLVGLPLSSIALLASARDKAPRVITAGLLVAVAAVVLPVVPEPGPLWRSSAAPALVAVVVVASLALAWLLFRRRGWSAAPALVVLHASWMDDAVRAVAPRSDGVWSVILLVGGFALLPAGVVVHRRLARMLGEDDGPRASAEGPLTPAAIGTFGA